MNGLLIFSILSSFSESASSQGVALALIIVGCVVRMVASFLNESDYVDSLCTAVAFLGYALIGIGAFMGGIYFFQIWEVKKREKSK